MSEPVETKKRNKQRIPRIELLRNKGETGHAPVMGTMRKTEMSYYDRLPEEIRRELQESAMQINALGIYEELIRLTPEGLLYRLKRFKEDLVLEHERLTKEATEK